MLDFTKTILNALKVYINERLLSSKSDWNQNDKTAPDYIKNRTHWEEEDVIELIPETKVSIAEDSDYIELGYFDQLVIGQTYVVTLNGVRYKCVARLYDEEDSVLIGNGTIYGDGDPSNNEPFSCDSYGDGQIYLNATPGEYTFSLAIYNQTVHKLDKKYLPDDIGGVSDWNQNDPEAPDYIKNRPFYEEIQYIAYIPEQTIEFTDYSGIYVSGEASDMPLGNLPWDLVPFRITVDGIEYEATMHDNGDNAWLSFSLNDGTSMTIYEYGGVVIYSTAYLGNHVIKVEQINNVIHPLDSKYFGYTLYAGTGENAICINNSENEASGDSSVAEGFSTVASGHFSHAEGFNTEATGFGSHAEGEYAEATVDGSHAEGSYTKATGLVSHAEGNNTEAIGRYSHAEGHYTEAVGRSQHVGGEYNIPDVMYFETIQKLTSKENICRRNASTTMLYHSKEYTVNAETGLYTLIGDVKNGLCYSGMANYIYGGTSGNTLYQELYDDGVYDDYTWITTRSDGVIKHSFRKSDEYKGQYVEIVGNGTNNNNRSNARTLDWEGNAWFAGKVFIGGTGQDDPNAVELGSGDSNTLIVTYTDDYKSSHTATEIYQAKQNGQNVVFVEGNRVYHLGCVEVDPSEYADFFRFSEYSINVIYINGNNTTRGYIDIGPTDNLSTKDKTIVGAINEINAKGGSGGSSVFTVTITGDEENGYSADKTFDEIVEANSSGKNVVAKWNYDGCDFVLYLNAIFDNESMVFSYHRIMEVGRQEGLNLHIEADGSIRVEWKQFDMYFDEYVKLNTTDKTVLGSINELHSKFGDIESICDEVIALQNSYINGVKVTQEGDTLIIQNGGDADA